MPDALALTAADLEYRTAGNDVIVHDPARARVHVLNRTAAYILQSCDGRRSAGAIAEELSTSTNVPHSRTLADVERALVEFRALGLVR